jgi:hypothetical protein
MSEIKNKDEKSSAVKDYLQGIFFLVIPIVIIYLIIKFL